MPKEYDTLYLVNKSAKEPYCFFNIEDRFTYDNNEIGNFVYLSVNAPNFLIANKVHARIEMNDDGETYSMNGDKITRYWVDKKDFSVCEITGFHNDFFGIDEEFDLKQLIKETLESENLDKAVKHRISTLNEQINKNDNPILVIGKLKTD